MLIARLEYFLPNALGFAHFCPPFPLRRCETTWGKGQRYFACLLTLVGPIVSRLIKTGRRIVQSAVGKRGVGGLKVLSTRRNGRIGENGGQRDVGALRVLLADQ